MAAARSALSKRVIKSPSSSLYFSVTSSLGVNWSLKTRCIIKINSS